MSVLATVLIYMEEMIETMASVQIKEIKYKKEEVHHRKRNEIYIFSKNIFPVTCKLRHGVL